MRFLTPDWHRGTLTDEEAEHVEAAFRAHRADFAASVTGGLRELATGHSLHDALIVSASVARRARTIVLRLRAGDQQRGYFDRTITYHGVQFEHANTAILATVARDSASEMLADELEVIDSGLYSHALLFWPQYLEVVIAFASAQVSDAPRPTRIVPALADRYAEVNAPAV